eukprot:TRINITY_DN2040_c0_g1_i1.p1 TRINITY_DN2040_c0_g1~~TRINITY_DN2040_c0_g1_i1.p1  ORF type:complete len:261 (-),score=65.36 TRINITY_DN2040_c0_g1_i1:7-789(-)
MSSLFNGPDDARGCFIEFQAGAGGADSANLCATLLGMYTNWGERHGMATELLDTAPFPSPTGGSDLLFRSATLRIDGENAYGWLRRETGVHRRVRISPYDTQKRRQTAFTTVIVTPVIEDDTADWKLDMKDVRIETCRSGGAGGQHVNKTESAVKAIYIPTGEAVRVETTRSQHQNRASALNVLQSKIYARMQKEKAAAAGAIRNSVGDSWGEQIRNYFIDPKQIVKDNRTGFESSQALSILDGSDELDKCLRQAVASLP